MFTQNGENMRFLYLVPKAIFDNKMSRVRFHMIKALSKISEVKYSGPGWKRYNIKEMVSQFKPDMIITYLIPDSPKNYGIKTPVCTICNEMYNIEEALVSINKLKPDLLIYHYKNDKPLWNYTKNVKFVNLPQCAEKTIFKDYNLPKKYDIIVGGVMGNEFYPLRTRLNKLTTRKLSKRWKCLVKGHPGYKLTNANNNSELIKFAKIINQSKITLTCTSQFKYALGKYVEIPMCNSLMGGDLPDERQDFFRSIMIVLDLKDSDEVLINKLEYYLKNDGKRKDLSKKGMDLILANYTHEHYAQRFIKVARDFLGGKI